MEVQAVLHSLNVLFLNKYEQTLKRWDGGTRIFQGFIPIIQQALASHNIRFVEKQELTSAEFLLSFLGETLDVLLVNILIGSAIFISCDLEKTKKLRESLDELFPFRIPHMVEISDVEIAQEILQSRKEQVQKTPTLLGVTGKVYDLLTTPEFTEHYLFLKDSLEGECVHQAPPNQLQMNIAKTSLGLGDSLSEQGKFLEFQLRELLAELRSFVSFRKNSPDLSFEDIQSLLHLSPERFELLIFLYEEFGSYTGPLLGSLSERL